MNEPKQPKYGFEEVNGKRYLVRYKSPTWRIEIEEEISDKELIETLKKCTEWIRNRKQLQQ